MQPVAGERQALRIRERLAGVHGQDEATDKPPVVGVRPGTEKDL